MATRSDISNDVAAIATNGCDSFKAQEVQRADDKEWFLSMPASLYKDDRHWIPYIRSEIKAVFDPLINPFFRHGTAKRWILLTKEKTVVGRLAAFVDYDKMNEGADRVGGIGFFECINDRSAAYELFQVASDWLSHEHHVTMIEGPINFGENDKFWGLRIKGEGYPSYGMTYNPGYYQLLFEDYGFRCHYKQFTNYLPIDRPLPSRFRNIAERVSKNPAYSFRHLAMQESEKFVEDFVEVYNQAWASFQGFKPIDGRVVRKSLKEMQPVIEEEFIWYAYVNERPVAFLVGVPDVNEILRFSGTDFSLWGKLKFLLYKKIQGFKSARVIVMGVIPEYQGHGIESALILRGYMAGQRKGYKHVQLAWVGDFNDKMMAIHRAMGAEELTVHATYRKLVS